jgi:PAS domain S-box-containing protein
MGANGEVKRSSQAEKREELTRRIRDLETALLSSRLREDALQAELRFLESLFATAQVIVLVLDREARILRYNPYLEKITGWPLSEMKGKEWFSSFLPSRNHDHIRQVFKHALHDLPTSPTINPIVTRDGRDRMIEWYNTTLKDDSGHVIGVLATGQDITERQQAEEALRASEERLRFVMSQLPGILWTVDEQLRLTLALGSGFAEIGIVANHDVGKTLFELFNTTDPEFEPIKLHYRALAGESINTLFKRGRFHLEAHLDPFRDKEGRIVGVIGVLIDVTEQRSLEARIRETQRLESLGILAGGIAHDFNNLLQGILGGANLALMELPAWSPARETIATIERTALRAAELTAQMLAYSGKGRFLIPSHELNARVEGKAHIDPPSVSKKAVLNYRFARDLPAIEGDAAQLRQVVMNLIINASESLGDNSGVITLTTGTAWIGRELLDRSYLDAGMKEGLAVFLSVSDTGCGMDQGTRAKIFDPFYTTKFTGRGLGLAAVLGIVRGHHGALVVESAPGRGSTFTVYFPALAESVKAEATPGEEAQGFQGHGLALLVDDEETVRYMGQLMLEKAGFQVLTAADGEEAVELFRRQGSKIECVVLDLTMPRMNGEETLNRLQELRPEVPVILSSGFSEAEIMERFAGRGLAGFVQKPYQYPQLLSALRKALAASKKKKKEQPGIE